MERSSSSSKGETDTQHDQTWYDNEIAFYNDALGTAEQTLARDQDPLGALQYLDYLRIVPGVLPVHYDIRRQVLVACCQMAWGRFPEAKDILLGCQKQWLDWIQSHPGALESLQDGDGQVISGMRTRIESLLAMAERCELDYFPHERDFFC